MNNMNFLLFIQPIIFWDSNYTIAALYSGHTEKREYLKQSRIADFVVTNWTQY